MAKSELDVRALSNKVAVVVTSNVATALIELAAVVILARLLPKREVAIIALLLVIYQTGRFLAVFGLPESVFYFYERLKPGARRAFVLQTATLLTGMGLAAGLLMVGTSFAIPWILGGWDAASRDTVAQLLPVLALVVVLELPTTLTPNVLLVNDRARQSAIFSVLNGVGGFVALVVPLLLGYNISVLAWSLAAFAAIRLPVTAIWLASILPAGREKLPPGLFGKQLRFAGPLALNSVALRLKKYIDRLVVAVMLTATALADYHVGAQEIPFLPVIAFGVGAVFISQYVSFQIKGDLKSVLDLWTRGIRAVSLIVVPATVIALVLAEDLVILLFGDQYLTAVLPFRIYTCILLVRVAQYGSMLQTFGDTKTILVLTISSLVANLVLNIPLTYFFGISGTAFATLLAMFMVVFLYLRRIAHHLETSMANVVPLRHYLQVFFLSLVVATGAYALRRYGLDGLPRPLAMGLSAAAYGVVFVAAGRALGLITAEHWSIVRGWMRLDFITQSQR
jgi:O-antigen/teichoic acid export membrane protein